MLWICVGVVGERGVECVGVRIRKRQRRRRKRTVLCGENDMMMRDSVA